MEINIKCNKNDNKAGTSMVMPDNVDYRAKKNYTQMNKENHIIIIKFQFTKKTWSSQMSMLQSQILQN